MSQEITTHGQTSCSVALLPKQYDSICVRSFNDVFEQNEQSIAELRQTIGDEGIRSVLSYGIAKLLSFINASNTMRPEQVSLTADLLAMKYNDINIPMFKLFIQRAMCGDFGQPYNSMDGQKILVWFNKFYQEYWSKYIDFLEQEDNKKRNGNTGMSQEVLDKWYSELKNPLPPPKVEVQESDKEKEERIRKEVIARNTDKYGTMPYEDAVAYVNGEIEKELLSAGIFKVA